MNQQSRVWIYQSNRSFNESEQIRLRNILTDFTKSWTAHNQQLAAGFEIKYNRFIILMVDETQAGASGCSIDKSVHLMKELEQEFTIDLFDRFHISWKQDGEVISASKDDFEQLIKEGFIHQETIVFNNLATNYQEYQDNWEVPFKNSWHPKVFKLQETI